MWEFVGQNNCFYKLNANCKDSEKTGSGPGSCGGKSNNNILGLQISDAKKVSIGKINERLQEAISKDGMKIYFPPGKQNRATGLYNQIEKLPNIVKQVASKYTFVFSSKGNKDDSIYSQTYGQFNPGFIGFQSAASTDIRNKIITSYFNRGFQFNDLLHELGHGLDFYNISLKNNRSLSESEEYINAVSLDNNYISNYAKVASENSWDTNNLKEDFADSIKEYCLNTDKFKNNFPNRFKYFSSLKVD